MNDPNPYSSGSGENDPPLSPKTPEVQREGEAHASQRAQEPRRIPEPVRGGCCGDGCLQDMKRSFDGAVSRHPCGSIALAFVGGILCGVLIGRDDHCRW